MTSQARAPDRFRRSPIANVARRIYLTYRYHGPGTLAFRLVTYPLRYTPLARFLTLRQTAARRARAQAAAWYRREGRHVTIVIPSYRDAKLVAQLVQAIRKTTKPGRVSVIVADDASGPQHVAELSAIGGITVIAGERNLGFAANVNRGLRARRPDSDVVLLNSDVIPTKGWLPCLAYAANGERVGLVGGKLLYPDDRIQYGGTVRNLGAPEWFDHRYRFRPANWGPANVGGPTLAVTGACMYITREALDTVGEFDESFPMAYEDVDFSLRVWQAGFDVVYAPTAVLYHLESATRGTEVGERERASQRRFWEKHGDFLDRRNVRTADGHLRVIYVTEDTGVGGGHRDIFEHLNRLAERGHDVSLWTLGGPPDWFPLRVPVRSFGTYAELSAALDPIEAIKVATWWNTADTVWRASVRSGIPVYFVQDIETSYYPDDETTQHRVLDSYKHEFRYMTISPWNQDRLRELGLNAELIPPGIDLENFKPLPERPRRSDMILALGRTNPLKNLPLTLEAWRGLREPRPELVLFGIEPQVVPVGESGIRYVLSPSDAEVAELFNQATVFVQTSTHEGFCLPPLEAMATGAAVVCTDAHGNRAFCRHEENCLMPESNARAVRAALQRLLDDAPLRARLGAAGRATAADFAWPRRIDALERFFADVATPRRTVPSTEVVPGPTPAESIGSSSRR